MTDTLLTGEQTETLDNSKDYFQELVGEGRKFKSKEDLAKGKFESDLYINTLQSRMDELRKDYLKEKEDNVAKARLEELIDQLNKTSQRPSNNEPTPPVIDGNQPKFDPKEIESLVSTKIQEHDRAKREQENFNEVRNKLKEQYGSNYQSVLKQKIEELGLDETFMNDLARKHPSVLLKTLGVGEQVQQEQFQSPPRSSIRNDNFKPSSGQKRTWAYYQDIKKNNPTLYHDPKTTVQMHKDYETLGSDFEDGDFNAI